MALSNIAVITSEPDASSSLPKKLLGLTLKTEMLKTLSGLQRDLEKEPT